MKVITPPTAIKPWRFTCRGCDAVLEASEGDLVTRTQEHGGNLHDAYTTTVYCVSCPLCGTLTDKEVPTGWAKTHSVPRI